MCEKPVIEELKSLGWKYIESREALQKRGNRREEVLLLDDLRDAIRRINSSIRMEDEDVEHIIQQLKSIPADIDGIEKFLYYFRYGITLPIKGEGNRQHTVRLFDLSCIENNTFTVTNQFSVEGLSMNRRLDILLFVNGIPLVSMECKEIKAEPSQGEEAVYGRELYYAYRDIKIYEKDLPDLYKFVQICIATDGERAKYFANAFNEEGKDDLKEWKDPYPYRVEGSILRLTLHGMLARSNLLDIIENFTFIRKEKGLKSKVVARYVQFRTVNRIYSRAVEWIRGRSDKRFGLIWHWQGSGKTYTMAFSAMKLWRALEVDNPSIFVIVDRRNLEEQIDAEFKALSIDLERIESIKDLREVLEWGMQGKRGIFLVTIEKFRPDEFRDIENVRIERRNVVVLVDEAHRTQYDVFASMMRSIFVNAAIFGFTGTPLSKQERNTFAKFSPEDELYLDRYSMLDSLNDGMTVSISYQARLPEYHKRHEVLDEIAELEERMVSELNERERKMLARRIDEKRSVIASDDRINAITKDIVKHFKEVVEPTGMKAMIVAYDRHTCVKYKRALDRHTADQSYSEVVFSFSSKENDRLIRDYVGELFRKYNSSDQKMIHERIVDDFKFKDRPKILIVTDMLITGFDSPRLWCMYIDKPLREHRLLQTIARTNRPYGNKEFGLIIDYIGILSDMKEALKRFETEDQYYLSMIIRKVDEKFNEFRDMLERTLSIFSDIRRDDSRESIDRALDELLDGSKAKEFEEGMRKLMKKYEWVKGNEEVAPLLNDYRWLLKIYAYYNARYKRSYIDELSIDKYSRKTKELIEQSIEVERIRDEYPILEIEEIVKKIKDSRDVHGVYCEGTDIALDILASIQRMLRDNPNKNSPFVLRLKERVDKIYEELRNRRLDVEELMKSIGKVIDEITAREIAERDIGGREIYAVYERIATVLSDSNVKVKEDELKELSKKIWECVKNKLTRNWRESNAIKREVRITIRGILIDGLKHSYDPEICSRIVDEVFDALSSIRGGEQTDGY